MKRPEGKPDLDIKIGQAELIFKLNPSMTPVA